MNLPYTKSVTFYNDESGKYYVSKVLELEGCNSNGDTEVEALENLKEAMECYLESCLAHGDVIPVPKMPKIDSLVSNRTAHELLIV